MRIVLDASVALAWLSPAPDTTSEVPDRHRELLASAVVPQTFATEVLNVLVKAERRRRGSDDSLDRQVARLQHLSLTVDEQTFSRLLSHTLPLARQQRLSIFDAAYLELAVRLDVALLTYDAGLIRAAGALSIPLA